MKNFYPDQYLKDKDYQINHNYLKEQFLDYEEIFNQIKEVVKSNDFTLGEAVDELESLIAKEADTEFAMIKISFCFIFSFEHMKFTKEFKSRTKFINS